MTVNESAKIVLFYENLLAFMSQQVANLSSAVPLVGDFFTYFGTRQQTWDVEFHGGHTGH